MPEKFSAHYKKINDKWETHLLEVHLKDVSTLSKQFSEKFQNGEWGFLIGLWHDLGKYNPKWQEYLRDKSGYNEEISWKNSDGKIDHSTAGAIFAALKWKDLNPNSNSSKCLRVIAYCIAGHHAGLADWVESGSLNNRLANGGEYWNKVKEYVPCELLNQDIPRNPPMGNNIKKEFYHYWIRFLFSTLIDADRLDTEKFMNPESFNKRGQFDSISDLNIKLKNFLAFFKKDSEINLLRNIILNDCLKNSGERKGFFSLNVPTGGGKTFSSMAFALGHCEKHKMDRVIIVVPYTSIIEQTVDVLKNIFNENLTEHHSNLDLENVTLENLLASENWDSPIIVTTNVQFFESLHSAKPSRSRKLHNIVNSVIILDEAQMLPTDFLIPVLDSLKFLVEYAGCSVVFCTATRPTLFGEIGSEKAKFNGIDEDKIKEIVISKTPIELSAKFSRVKLEMPESFDVRISWDELALRLSQYNQVLCIVNTRKDCFELFNQMPQETILLSNNLCGKHKSFLIKKIKQKLKDNLPIRVISTQLVEAGVDLDFPVIFRSLCGLDSIAQAAGRCNREGKLEKGQVIVFNSPSKIPQSFKKNCESTIQIYHSHKKEFLSLSPLSFDLYFKEYYKRLNDFDRINTKELVVTNSSNFEFEFRTLSEKFNLISDIQKSIIVKYEVEGESNQNLIDLLKFKGPEKWLLQKLQRYVVNVYENQFNQLKVNDEIEEIQGYWVQKSTILYDNVKGISSYQWDNDNFIL